MIDTHCHLTDPRLRSQLADVLALARAAGVTRMITIGTGLADDAAAIALCRGRQNLRCAVGVHPNYSHAAELHALPRLRRCRPIRGRGARRDGARLPLQFAPPRRQRLVVQPQLQWPPR